MHASALTKAAAPLVLLDSNGRGGKYLIFNLGEEEFGAEVLKVREIMGMQDITNVPHMPPFVQGVINLRGKVIAVVDLRLKFGLPRAEYTQRTCIIVISTHEGEDNILVGMIVDGVAEVLTLTELDIEDTPDFGSSFAAPWLKGMAKVKGNVKILLDIDQVLGSGDINDLRRLPHQMSPALRNGSTSRSL